VWWTSASHPPIHSAATAHKRLIDRLALPIPATPNPLALLYMPECEQPSYSQYTPLPSTSDPCTSATPQRSLLMTFRDTLLGLKSRSQEHATRVSSGDFTGNDVEIEDPTVYKVYKRRWFGVAIIMLLNIVSSWRYVRERYLTCSETLC